MLIRFRIKNFRSFKDLNEFSMIKGKQRFFETRTAEVGNLKLLNFSALFGANASGKSNLIRALKTMQFIVLNNAIPLDSVGECYKLDDTCLKEPSYFETVFSVGKEVYSYGFEINLTNRVVESEWLYLLHKKSGGEVSETLVFEKSDGQLKLGKDGASSPRLSMYRDDVLLMPTKLFLSHVASFSYAFMGKADAVSEAILKAYRWFQSSLRVLYTGEALFMPELTARIDEGKMGKVLSAFDTGIKSIAIKKVSENEFRRALSNVMSLDLNALQNALATQQTAKGEKSPSFALRTPNDLWLIDYKKEQLTFSRVEFYHDEEKKHPFRVDNESDGTIRLFELADALLNTDPEKVLVIDELDRCLHPMLTVQFVKAFLNKASDENDTSQFIVSTHESRLLDFNILRRDEIWFVKKEENASHIYSLEEYNVRFDKVIDQAYLDGRYGGVPVFDNIFFPENVIHENKES